MWRAVRSTYDLAHKILDSFFSTKLRYRFPEPTWHGHSQELLYLRGTDPNHREKMEKRPGDLRVQFPLLQPLVTRGIHRGHIAESAYGYQVLTIKPLVELLRMRYCPERYDCSRGKAF